MVEHPPGADGWLAACRAQGADRHDPVRFRLIEAMARRTAGHAGPLRERLAQRLQQLIDGYPVDAPADVPAEATRPGTAPAAVPPGPLARLVAALAAPSDVAGPPGAPALHELKTLGYFRSTWSRLSAERRLTQSLAQVPDNAGPLNSQQLVHRALQLMRELSPGYLEHFVQHVDGLLWLDELNAAAPAARKPATGERRRS